MTGMSKKIKTQTWSGFLFTQTGATNHKISVAVKGNYEKYSFLSLLTFTSKRQQPIRNY